MNGIFFFDVDTQHDFMIPGGALYVPGAEKIVPRLRRLFDCARRNRIFVLSSVDAHTPNDPEFADFPPHCVKGTAGQRKIDATLMERALVLESRAIDRNIIQTVARHPQVVLEKQTLDIFSNPMTERFVRALPPHAVVFGVATEYCVLQTALGLRRLGVKTAVLEDAIRALGRSSGARALDEMRAAGVETTTSDTLLGAYAA